MEKEQAGGGREKATPTGEQYLVALIRCAKWVSDEYKEVALSKLENIEFLKELYLCACDNVPIEKIREALAKKNPENVLRFLRKKQLEEIAIGDSDQRLDDIMKKAISLENEVKNVSKVMNKIEEQMPDMALFVEEDFPVKEETGPASSPVVVQETSDALGKEEMELQDAKGKPGMRRHFFFTRKRKHGISGYIEELLKEDYAAEQLEFLMDCIEDGMQPEEIREFANPAFPVKIMRRLRAMQKTIEGGKQNG